MSVYTSISRYLSLGIIKKIALISFIYSIIFNVSIIYSKIIQYQSASTLLITIELVKEFVLIYLYSFFFFLALSISKITFILGSLFLCIMAAINNYYYITLDVKPTLHVINSVFDTNMEEASDFIDAKLIITILCSIIMSYYFVKYACLKEKFKLGNKFISAIALVIITSQITHPSITILRTYIPVKCVENIYLYFFNKYNIDGARQDLNEKFEFKISKKSEAKNDDFIGILIIGESARYDHFGINGYNRDTTPNLSNMDNLFSFKARSCASSTYISVPCMLSRYNESELENIHTESSVLSVLTALNFDTSWIASVSLGRGIRNLGVFQNMYDDVNNLMLASGSVILKNLSYDTELLPFIKDEIENTNNKNRQFITVHTKGSHWNYALKYPEEFNKFQPTYRPTLAYRQMPSSMTKDELINSYDNSILHTDYLISEIISYVKNENAFVIYVSDHGQSLGENGKYTHGSEEFVTEQRIIPFTFWFSDKFKNNNQQILKNLDSHKDTLISHDNLFHTILDCIGIESEAINKDLSLCRHKKNNI